MIVYTSDDGEPNMLRKDSIPLDERGTPSPTWDVVEIYDFKDGDGSLNLYLVASVPETESDT